MNDEEIISAYVDVGKPTDQLPYSKEFDELAEQLSVSSNHVARHRLWLRICYLRKCGRLPRTSRKALTQGCQ
jgi:hypothetical protein